MPKKKTQITSDDNLKFHLPHPDILQLADYKQAPYVTMDTDKKFMLLCYRNTYKTLTDLSEEEIGLAGIRINPAIKIASSIRYYNNLKIEEIDHKDKEPFQVEGLPENPRIAYLTWSPDEKKIAFTHSSSNAVELWLLDVATAKATKLSNLTLNAVLGNPIKWFRDSQNLLARICSRKKTKLIDSKKDIPLGPILQNSNAEEKAQNRTYQDLLKNAADEENFLRLATSELHQIDLKGDSQLFKKSDLYYEEAFSPDGKYLLVTTLQKPFSYIVPIHRFAKIAVVYDLSGKKVKTVNDTPLFEALPKGFMAVERGKRELRWRSDKASVLFYTEALDEGDPQKKVSYRDALYQWNAPFTNAPLLVAKTKLRFLNVFWGDDNCAAIEEYWYDTRLMRTSLINPSSEKQKLRLLFERNFQDIYSDPGSFELRKNKFGKYVLAIENDNIYLVGDGYSAEGKFPFVDELNLTSLKKKRLYQSVFTDKTEDILSIEDFEQGKILLRIESKNEYPNYFFRNIKGENSLTQITFFPNPFESFEKVYKEVIKYKREDAVELSGTLYLPAGTKKGQKKKLPLLIWAYPSEYKDKQSAGQSISNPNEFSFPHYGSFLYWAARGYAVLDDAAFPILGEGDEEPNDSFIEQLLVNAKAAIDAVDELGVIDRTKVAVGGHSYGAFMVANLLTYSDLFACGIARSGAYNRTLTPFGFQHEQRNYWEAPDVYHRMSPLMNADKMKTPILLVHGETDNNPGTFTLQTERYFQALKGLGAPARMLILPKESHSYVAQENIMHLLWEQDRFLEEHLK